MINSEQLRKEIDNEMIRIIKLMNGRPFDRAKAAELAQETVYKKHGLSTEPKPVVIIEKHGMTRDMGGNLTK